jgi:hypothetical protein
MKNILKEDVFNAAKKNSSRPTLRAFGTSFVLTKVHHRAK